MSQLSREASTWCLKRPAERAHPRGPVYVAGRGCVTSSSFLSPSQRWPHHAQYPSQSTGPCPRHCSFPPHSLPGLPASSLKDHSLVRGGFLSLTVPLSCSNASHGSPGHPYKRTSYGAWLLRPRAIWLQSHRWLLLCPHLPTQSEHGLPFGPLGPSFSKCGSCMSSFGITGKCA